MIIAHVSDTHGKFSVPIPDAADVIFHSGDFCPNFTHRSTVAEEAKERIAQEEWLNRNQGVIDRWRDGRDVFVIGGNHDHADFNLPGLFDVSMKNFSINGLKCFGFPWTWTDNKREKGWFTKTEKRMLDMISMIPAGLDVLLAHQPPWMLLDEEGGDHYGNPYIFPALASTRKMLCGHVHGRGGTFTTRGGCTVYNSATTCQLIEVASNG